MELLKLDEIQPYYDADTGEKLSLWFGEHKFYIDGISVSLSGVPLLRNNINGNIHFPNKTKHMISYFVGEAKKK